MKVVSESIDAAVAAQSDIFGRDDFAAGLLRLFGDSAAPLVVALDEPWGTGKTVFAKRFERLAQENGFKPIYFDAFKGDYDPDVFVALAAAVIGELGSKGDDARGFREQATGVAKVVGRVALKGLVRAATGGVLKVTDISEAHDEMVQEIASEAEVELDKLIDARLSNSRAEKTAFEQFSASLEKIVSSGGGKPIVFIVDEIDRCRPDYSLSILEVAKHFFSVNGVHFLIMSQLSYLASCVSSRYGGRVDANSFLEKFVQVRVTFPILDKNEEKQAIRKFVSAIVNDLPDDGEDGKFKRGMVDFVCEIAARRKYTLRRTERILTQFGLCLAFSKPNTFRLGALVHILCDLKFTDQSLFTKAKIGQLKWVEIKDLYGLEDQQMDWYGRWLRYFLDPTIDRDEEQWASMSRSLWNWSLSDDPIDTVKHVANKVVDRISA